MLKTVTIEFFLKAFFSQNKFFELRVTIFMSNDLDEVKISVERFISEPFEEKLLDQDINEIFHYTTADPQMKAMLLHSVAKYSDFSQNLPKNEKM